MAAGGDHVTKWIDRRQFAPSRERNDQVTSNRRQCASRHDQAAIRRAGEGLHGALDLACVSNIRSASRPQQGAGELPGLMKRDRASSTDLEAGRLTGLARSRSGHCPILEAMNRHGFRETVRPLDH